MLAALLLPIGWTQAEGQLVGGADVVVGSREVWRGLTRVDGLAVQPSLYAAWAMRESYVSFGGGWIVEPQRGRSGHPSLVGVDDRGIGEFDVWAEYRARSGPIDWAIGAARYQLYNAEPVGTLPSRFSTHELYGSIRITRWPIHGALGAWIDVDAVDGLYYELDLTFPMNTLPASPVLGSLNIGTRIGASDGQARDEGDPTKPHYFDRDGVTHLELYGRVAVAPWRRVILNLGVHHLLARDGATRLSRGSATSSSTTWLEAALSWSIGVASSD